MEKFLWLALAVLWSCLLGGAATGAESDRSTAAGASVRPVTTPIAAMTQVAAPVTSAVDLRALRPHAPAGPVVVLGNGNGTELLGGIIGSGLLVHYARRRRFI